MKQRVRNRKVRVLIVLSVMGLCFTADRTHSNVSISEIMFGSERRFTPPQWIELFNHGSDVINLDGWKLTIQNRNSPDLTGPVNATILFADDFWGDAPRVWPNETILIVTTRGENSGNVREEDIYDLRWRQDLGLGLWGTFLSAEGFYLELTDTAGNIVDTVGNFQNNAIQWQLPLGANRGRNRAGHRVSMIRHYVNGVPLDGTQAASWISAENAGLAADQQTHYGTANDISSPGIGPIDMPIVPPVALPEDAPIVPSVEEPSVNVPVVDCQVGMVLGAGQSCRYPGTDAKFTVLDNGLGQFLNLTFAALNFRDTNINGQFYTLVANTRDDGSWTIEQIGTVDKPAVEEPSVNVPVVDCQAGMVLVQGQSCTYPGTDAKFTVLNNGLGQFLNLTFAALNFRDTNINGQFYTLVANTRDDGSWTIEQIGTVEKPAAVNPRDRQWLLWGQLKANHESLKGR